MKTNRWLLYVALVVLYALHNDWWLWDDGRLAMGLPIGIAYHIGYMVASAALMFLLVRFAWPTHLQVDEHAGDDR